MSAIAAIEAKFASVLGMLVPLNGLSVQRRQQLFAQAEVLQFHRGNYVFHEGDKDNYAFFLLEGELELYSGRQLVKRMAGATADAVHPLSQLQPRQLSARAVNEIAVLRVERDLLDKLLALDGAGDSYEVKVSEIEAEDDGDWMTRMLQSELFARVPAANIQRIFSCLEAVEYKAGDVIVSQGEPGDYYYVIQSGRCQVNRLIASGKVPVKLAELGPGDTFGEEALVSDAKRNATVTMLTNGTLMRLTKLDFIELIKKPLLSHVTLKEGLNLVEQQGARWLDVRFPEEHKQGAMEDSLNLPLNTLRMHAERLDRSKTYVVCCDSGSRSSVGAFLLSERGFDVHYLVGGLGRYGLLRGEAQADPVMAKKPPGAKPASPEREIAKPGAVQPVEALVPASHRSDEERRATGVRERESEDGLLEADLRAQALKAELAKANIQLEEARKLKEQAEQARLEVVASATDQLKAERARLVAEADKARHAWEAAQRLKDELERAKQATQAEAVSLREREFVELQEANRKLEEAQRLNQAAEAARLQMERELAERMQSEQAKQAELMAEAERSRKTWEAEAQRLKEQLEMEKRAAEAHAARRREQEIAEAQEAVRQLEEARRLKEEAEAARLEMEREAARRLQEEQAKLRAEAEQARKTWEEAQRLKEQLELEKRQTEEEAARLRAREIAELQVANERLEEARRQQQEAEAARLEMEREAAYKLQEEQAKLVEEAERAQRNWEEAQRLKEQLELEKKRAEEEAAHRHEQEEERLAQLREEAEERLKQEERKLEESYAWQAEELARLQQMKDDAEHQLAVERERLKSESLEALQRLAEAKRIQHEVAQTRLASAEEAELRQQRQLELERKLREEIQAKVDTERRKLEAEFARNAEELERARREKAAAEAARNAAAEEAERIIEEYKQSHQQLREREEAALRAERERLEAESAQLRSKLQEAQHAREEALQTQQHLEEAMTRLGAERQQEAVQPGDLDQQLASDIAAIKAEVNEARANAAAAEAAHRRAQAAALANQKHIEQHRQDEAASRGRFETEIESWLREQEHAQSRGTNRKIFANQKAHLERIKQRAQTARTTAKAHDQALIEELAARLKDD